MMRSPSLDDDMLNELYGTAAEELVLKGHEEFIEEKILLSLQVLQHYTYSIKQHQFKKYLNRESANFDQNTQFKGRLETAATHAKSTCVGFRVCIFY
ncbi:hypothetical protein [Nostoc sp.]|uniref:hypothetical protein n=1 Tax=Nostoc sp. TaxID=1180 RepID=UPI002FFC54D8